MFYQYETKSGLDEKPIALFAARIAQIAIDEAGVKTFTVTGQGERSGAFTVEVPESEFINKALVARLGAAAHLDPIMPDTEKHLLAAVKRLSGDAPVIRRITRPTWQGGKFTMPGRAADGLDVRLHPRLPFALDAGADLHIGRAALAAVVRSAGDVGPVILAYMLGAPLGALLDWERYALFVHGRTGRLKTSHMQVFQSIYGAGFRRDSVLVKWGEGSTKNALMALASSAGDLPLLIDNFKPQHGGGVKGLNELLHNIIEGGDKDRLTRASELRFTRPVTTWPIFTGEDRPDTDAAALSRVLLVRLERDPTAGAGDLTDAQAGATHLNAIGAAWLDWLESDAGQDAAHWAADQFDGTRAVWLRQLGQQDSKAANIRRIASNLALNQLSLQVAAECPDLADLVRPLLSQHKATLATLATMTAGASGEASEGERFIATLRELLATGRYLLRSDDPKLREDYGAVDKSSNPLIADRIIGKIDDAGVWLLPDVALRAVNAILPDRLNNVSGATLWAQLAELGYLLDGDKAGRSHLQPRRLDGALTRMLGLDRSALWPDEVKPDNQKIVEELGL